MTGHKVLLTITPPHTDTKPWQSVLSSWQNAKSGDVWWPSGACCHPSHSKWSSSPSWFGSILSNRLSVFPPRSPSHECMLQRSLRSNNVKQKILTQNCLWLKKKDTKWRLNSFSRRLSNASRKLRVFSHPPLLPHIAHDTAALGRKPVRQVKKKPSACFYISLISLL